MKAVNNNGKIKVYASVPDSFQSSTGVHMNAPKMSEEELKNAGMFDVVIGDNYDERVHTLGEIYFDSSNTVFKKDLVVKEWTETLDELKTKPIFHVGMYKKLILNHLNFNTKVYLKLVSNHVEQIISYRILQQDINQAIHEDVQALVWNREMTFDSDEDGTARTASA